MSTQQPQTWGSYLDHNKKDIQGVLDAFKERGCPLTLYEAAQFRELALMRSTIAEDSDIDRAERDEADEWKNE